MEMEQTNSSATNGHAHNGHDGRPAPNGPARADNGDSVLILYGTVTGNAELLANKLSASLRHAGVTARVRDMAHCQPSVLTQANCVLVVISTYGDGEPPDDAATFWEAVVQGNSLDLRGVKIFRARARQHHLRSFLQVWPRLRRRPGAPRRHTNPSARRLRRRLRRAGQALARRRAGASRKS